MPADSASPSGMLTTALPQVRLQAKSASGGSKLTVIQKSEGGVWFRTKNVLDLDSGELGELIFDNRFGSTAYHVLQENGGYAGNESGTVTAYIAGATAAVDAGDLTASNLISNGDLTVGDDATITDDCAVGGDLAVTGTLAVTSTTALTGNATAAGTLTVTGQVSANGGVQIKGSAPSAAADAVMKGVADINGATTGAEKTIYEGGATKLQRVNGTGALKVIEIAEDVADDGTIALPAPASGKVGILDVAEVTEWGKFSVQSDGTITKLDGSTNAVATDTDTKFCLFSSTGTPTFRNRLGSSKPIVGVYRYY